jgi:hypothetical protein
MSRLDLLIRFVLSATIGAGGAVGIGTVVRPTAITPLPRVSSSPGPSSASTAPVGPVAVTGPSGAPLNFVVQPTGAPPEPIPPLPAPATIQLASAPGPGATPGTLPSTPWWNPSVPRIPPISQFDGGPLQGYNCTLASGAMLARLAFGVVTTGSQLRALSGVPSGGTTLNDLARALNAGWGVHFFAGGATPLQLRALLYGGAGATIQLDYSQIPVSLRLQANFLGGHAIYLDGFQPAGPTGPAAYYVIDPIGRPWAGYRGGWWPADVVENAAVVFGHGRIYSAWAFPGGSVPANHPILPPSAYPGVNPGETPSPSPLGSPGITPGTSPTVTPSVTIDPMPPGDLIGGGDVPAGTPPPDVPQVPTVDIETGGLVIAPPPSLPCTSLRPGGGCPVGILGVIAVAGAGATGSSPPESPIHFLYANAIAPGTYQFVLQAPPNTQASVWLWPRAATNGTLVQVSTESAILNGQQVLVGTATLDPTADYSFTATGVGQAPQAAGPVGTLVVHP